MGNFTLAHVAREAGLSQGIVNLHFNSKDNLLSETLLYLVEEYYAAYMQALDRAGPDSASKLLALMEMDMSPSICDRTKLAVWFAFWGEVRAVPTYQKLCADYDARYDEILVQLCEDIIRDGEYRNVDAQTVTDAL
jgi:AcrR family transcriptional regulator